MTADASGVAPLTYQWFHNGNALANETNRILNFTNVTLAQAGDYTAAVSNAFGGVVSGPGTLTVTPTVLSTNMTRLWELPPGSRPYINTDASQRGLAYNPVNNHVLVVSRTGSNAIHVLDGDTGAHLWSMNVDPAIVTGGTFAINLVEVTDDGVVYAGNLTQDGNFKLYKWADDSETAVPELVWGPGNPAGLGTLPAANPAARWGDAMDLKGGVTPALVLTSRNTNYVSIIELWDVQLTPKVAHLDTLAAGALGLGVAFGADPQAGGYTIWGTALDVALRQIERELALLTVSGHGEHRIEALRLADVFRARVVDTPINSFVFELTGGREKIDGFIALMRQVGLCVVARTGIVAIARGDKAI